MGAALGALKGKEVQNWLNDIIIYTPAVEGLLELVSKVLEALYKAELSINLAKCRENVGTVTRAVTRSVTRGLAEAADQIPPMPKPTPDTETDTVKGGHKEVSEPSRTPQTRAPPDPQAAATPKEQPIPKRRNPPVTETARLLKDHAYLAGRQKRDATLGPMLKESGSAKDQHLTDDNGVLWYAPRGAKTHPGDTEDVDTGGDISGPQYLRLPRRGPYDSAGTREIQLADAAEGR